MKAVVRRDGLLPVLKPPGLTSHDVVARVRRLLGVRRVGHAGTLDPGAAGVLLLLVGRGTRLAPLLQAEDKTYVAEMFLGIATDTQDGYGRPVKAAPDCRVGREELSAALARFVGPVRQVPPMTSAVRRGGRRLYEWARQGVEVERPARTVHVRSLELLRVWRGNGAPEAVSGEDGPKTLFFGTRVLFRVVCSKGTYVRTLCHDIGERLGCGAYMSFLLRTRAGDVGLDQTWTLDELEREAAAGSAPLLPMDAALGRVPRATLDRDRARRAAHGQPLFLPGPPAGGTPVSVADGPGPGGDGCGAGRGVVRLYDEGGRLLALARRDGQRPDLWRPFIVFSDERGTPVD